MSHANVPPNADSLLQFYQTANYPCSYLNDREAKSLVATPPYMIDTPIYSQLVRKGFRRSGLFAYRPACDRCQACIPVRLPVAQFSPNRSQRRCLKLHCQLHACEQPLIPDEAHYALYQRYQTSRHAGGGMDDSTPTQYADFLLQSPVDTRLIAFTDPYDRDALRMVSIIDVLDDGLSSVYTFFEPDHAGSSFGKYGILWQIAQCLARGLPYLYLGYWIEASPKMSYKADYTPLEGLIDGIWRLLPTRR